MYDFKFFFWGGLLDKMNFINDKTTNIILILNIKNIFKI